MDDCSNSNFISVLEEDRSKGNDTCILRIYSADRSIDKIEMLNIPVDRSMINYCESDYVVVGFSCGGPYYSQVFVFTDQREKKQFTFSQKVSNNQDIIAHIKNEEFDTLLIRKYIEPFPCWDEAFFVEFNLMGQIDMTIIVLTVSTKITNIFNSSINLTFNLQCPMLLSSLFFA